MRRLLLVLLVVAGLTVTARGAVPCDVLQPQPRCYVALVPGPTRDALGVVDVRADETSESGGQLLLTTVIVDSELDVGEWLRGTLSRRIEQVPREVLFPDGAGREDVAEQNAARMAASQLDATIAALSELGYDFDEDIDGARVVELTQPRAATTEERLGPEDVIVAADGTAVTSTSGLVEAVRARRPGETMTLEIWPDRRRRRARTVTVELVEDPDAPGRGVLGAVVVNHLELPVDVRIDAGVIGGPSAGLMFSLAIVDRLDPEDLTGGRIVAGTGTIDRAGAVGSIGGIAQKLVGALDREGEGPADVFLVPEGNLDAARAAPVDHDVLVVPVGSLRDALDALTALRAGERPADALALRAS